MTSIVDDARDAWPAPIVLAEVDSTQRVARERALQGAPHGTVVVAQRQTAGRGRLGRTWLAPSSGVYASVVLRPALPSMHAWSLTLAAVVGVVRALDALGVPGVCIKWPNDVVLARAALRTIAPSTPDGRLGPYRKVGGLLVEVVEMDATHLRTCILGVGINVQGPAGGWPDELIPIAASLRDAAREHTDTVDEGVDVNAVVDALRTSLPDALRLVHDDDGRRAIVQTLRARSATLGRVVTADVDGTTITGRAIDLHDDGALLVRTDDGETHAVRAGEVWLP